LSAAKQAFVVPLGGLWVVKVDGLQKSNSSTQALAIVWARMYLKSNGGGEIVVLNEQGQIRQKDTVHPGNDPQNSEG